MIITIPTVTRMVILIPIHIPTTIHITAMVHFM